MTAAVTPGREELLALAESLGRVVPEHSADRRILLEAERAIRLAAKPTDEGVILGAINKVCRNHVIKMQSDDRYILTRAIVLALSPTAEPKPLTTILNDWDGPR